MPIITSQIIQALPQADGRSYITERHTDHTGATHDHEYLADVGLDTDLVMRLRAERLGAAIDAREAAEAAAQNFVLPVTKYTFRQRFTEAERIACDAFNATYEQNPALTDAQRAMIRSGLEDFSAASAILPSIAMPMLNLYEALGLIAPGRAAEIGAV